MPKKIVIVGNGVAGYTAALRVRRRQPDWRITMISGESDYPFSRPALMYVFLGHMRYRDIKPHEDHVWSAQRIERVRDWVTRVDTAERRVLLASGSALDYDELLLATGSRPNKFGWPGQDLEGVQGFYSLADLARLNATLPRVRRAVIVGGGLIGVELAEMLHARSIPVTLLVRERAYWDNVLPREEAELVSRLIQRAGFDLRLETQLTEIVDDGHGRACAIETDKAELIECQLVGLTAGVGPNVELAKRSEIPVARGVLVDSTLRSRVEGVWAAGDCAEIAPEGAARGALHQVWYTGRSQGEVAGDGLAGAPRKFEPGVWFNSAKFLDLEYQVYGAVNRSLPGERNLYWEHSDGRRAIRIVYTSEGVVGFNVMGLRMRQEQCERWIVERAPLERVLAELERAHFDPEFFEFTERVAAAAMTEALR